MKQKKIIAVVGATGAQGGAVVEALLNDPSSEFAARALTRNSNSEKSKALAEKGAEVVEADISDKSSLIRTFKGAYGAFCVTFFWEHFSPEKEMKNAQNMAEAAKEANLSHVIWSTLEDTRKWVPLSDDRMPTLMDNYKVPHFDAKGVSNAYFERSGVPYTLLITSFFWENFIYFGAEPQYGPDGELAITFPLGDAKMPGIAVADIGKCAMGIFKARDDYKGKTVGIAGEHLSGGEMAEVFTKILGKKIKYNAVPPEIYRSFGFPGADDLGNMYQFKTEFESDFRKARNVDEARRLNPELQSFEAWLIKNKAKIPVHSQTT
ncbi:MAG: NmrA/HSCARG family protein [Flavobacteriaceae bacterium]|nr:NmrA/HSCARG family protein [Flavobacteriaceae bacterium]